MEACWHQDPKQRPDFHTVARRLKAMQRWYWACNNALKLSSTTLRLQYLRQNSKNRDQVAMPVAAQPVQHAPTAAAEGAGKQAAAAAAGGDGAGGFAATVAAAAAAGGLSGQLDKGRDLLPPPQQHGGLDDLQDDMPPPVPEPEDVAAVKAAAAERKAEPSVQVRQSMLNVALHGLVG